MLLQKTRTNQKRRNNEQEKKTTQKKTSRRKKNSLDILPLLIEYGISEDVAKLIREYCVWPTYTLIMRDILQIAGCSSHHTLMAITHMKWTPKKGPHYMLARVKMEEAKPRERDYFGCRSFFKIKQPLTCIKEESSSFYDNEDEQTDWTQGNLSFRLFEDPNAVVEGWLDFGD